MDIKKILVPVDLSSESLEALDRAIAFAKPYKAELIALLVIEPVTFFGPTYDAQTGPLAEVLASLRRSAREELAGIEKRYFKRGVPLRAMVEIGVPARVIIESAKRLKANLIIMSTRGRTGLAHVLTGSVAERVVRTAPCPVMTMHPRSARARTRSTKSSTRRAEPEPRSASAPRRSRPESAKRV